MEMGVGVGGQWKPKGKKTGGSHSKGLLFN